MVIAIVIIIIVILFFVFLGIVFFMSVNNGNAKPIDPDNCNVSTNSVPSISGLPCCIRNGEPTQFKFYEPYNSVLGPNPVFWSQACSGFCENGDVSSDMETCKTGSSQQYQQCTDLTKPRNCKGLAMPVAADGIRLFYINSATKESCEDMGSCS